MTSPEAPPPLPASARQAGGVPSEDELEDGSIGARRWLPTILVLFVLLGVTAGGYVAAAALSVPAGPPVSVADVLSIQPLSGWERAGTFVDPQGVELTRGNGTLDAFAFPPSVSGRALLARFVNGFLASQAVNGRFSVSPHVERVFLAGSGLAAFRVSYVGVFSRASVPIEGEVTVAASSSGFGVVLNGWAPLVLLEYVIGDIHGMIDRAQVR